MKESQEDDVIDQLTCDEFISRFRRETSALLCKIYVTDYELEQSNGGTLTFPLGEDVFTLVHKLLSIIREYLYAHGLVGTSAGYDLIFKLVGFIFDSLRCKQIHFQDNFLSDIESCCAAANTFIVMLKQCEAVTKEVLCMLHSKHNLPDDRSLNVKKLSSRLVSLYNADAIYCAQYVHIHVFPPIRKLIGPRLFTKEWENIFIKNELAASVVKTIEDYFLNDISCYLADSILIEQAVQSLLDATVTFYLNAILIKAKKQRHSKSCCFTDPETALQRMNGDISVLKTFFKNYFGVEDRVIESKFFIFSAMCAAIAAADKSNSKYLRRSILYIHSITKNAHVTKLIVVDLCTLFVPHRKRLTKDHLRSLKKKLKETTVVKPEHDWGKNRRQVPTESMLRVFYEKELLSKTKHKHHYTSFVPDFHRAKLTSTTVKSIFSPKYVKGER